MWLEAKQKARLWQRLEPEIAAGQPAGAVSLECMLCAQRCQIRDGRSGNCGVRFNHGGELFTVVGDKLSAINLDPVEKKPLFHFLPGSMTFSVGALGCNLHCRFCQNSAISQVNKAVGPRVQSASPAILVENALASKAGSISYTYNEPVVFFELMQDTAALALDNGLRNIMVSNGYMSEECFSALDGLIQAINIDLKSFSDDFYRKICGARLEPVLQNLQRAVRSGWWVEVTTLVISGLNDSPEELGDIASFISTELGPDVPWHVSRFHPAYRMQDIAQTSMYSLERAVEAGVRKGLKYVYAGNVPGHGSESTYCPACQAILIRRFGYRTEIFGSGCCPECGLTISGVWE